MDTCTSQVQLARRNMNGGKGIKNTLRQKTDGNDRARR